MTFTLKILTLESNRCQFPWVTCVLGLMKIHNITWFCPNCVHKFSDTHNAREDISSHNLLFLTDRVQYLVCQDINARKTLVIPLVSESASSLLLSVDKNFNTIHTLIDSCYLNLIVAGKLCCLLTTLVKNFSQWELYMQALASLHMPRDFNYLNTEYTWQDSVM